MRNAAILFGLLLLGGLALSCGGDPLDPGEGDPIPEPPDNYIPIFSEVCQPEDEAQLAAVSTLLTGVLSSSELWGAETLELCDESSCAPCDPVSNPVLGVLRDAESWLHPDAITTLTEVTLADGTTDLSRKMESYFNQALAYPWRQLILASPTGASGPADLTFLSAAGRYTTSGTGYNGEQCSEASPCSWTSLTPDSLDTSCTQLNTVLPVSVDAEGQYSSMGPSPSTFGFWVPLADSLPDPLSFASDPTVNPDQAFQEWLDSHADIRVALGDLQISATNIEGGHTGDDGTVVPAQCVTLSGSFDASRFGLGEPQYAAPEGEVPPLVGLMHHADSLSAYSDSAGKIGATLSMKIIKFSYP